LQFLFMQITGGGGGMDPLRKKRAQKPRLPGGLTVEKAKEKKKESSETWHAARFGGQKTSCEEGKRQAKNLFPRCRTEKDSSAVVIQLVIGGKTGVIREKKNGVHFPIPKRGERGGKPAIGLLGKRKVELGEEILFASSPISTGVEREGGAFAFSFYGRNGSLKRGGERNMH